MIRKERKGKNKNSRRQNKSMEYMKSIWTSIKQKSVKTPSGLRSLNLAATFDENQKKNSSSFCKEESHNQSYMKTRKRMPKNQNLRLDIASRFKDESDGTFKFSLEDDSNGDFRGKENLNFGILNSKNRGNFNGQDYFPYTNEVKTVKNASRSSFSRNFNNRAMTRLDNSFQNEDSIKVKSYLNDQSTFQERPKKLFDEMKEKIEGCHKVEQRLKDSKRFIKELQNRLALKEMEISEMKAELKNYKIMLKSVKPISGTTLSVNIENERLRKDIKSLITIFKNFSKKSSKHKKDNFLLRSTFEKLNESMESKGEMTYLETFKLEEEINNGGNETKRKRSKKRRRHSRCSSCKSDHGEMDTKKNFSKFLDDFFEAWIPKEVSEVLEHMKTVMKMKDKKFSVLKKFILKINKIFLSKESKYKFSLEKNAAKKIERLKLEYLKTSKIEPPTKKSKTTDKGKRQGFVEGALFILSKITEDIAKLKKNQNIFDSRTSSFFRDVKENDSRLKLEGLGMKVQRYFEYIKDQGFAKDGNEEFLDRINDGIDSDRSFEVSCDSIFLGM